jgi:hypothetical protein
MKQFAQLLLFWSPRLLCILFILFISLFALDSFESNRSIIVNIQAFAIHLIPSFFLVVVLIVSWKWEWIGALVFNGLGLAYALMNLDHPDWIAVISTALFLVGILFLIGWIYRKEIRGKI